MIYDGVEAATKEARLRLPLLCKPDRTRNFIRDLDLWHFCNCKPGVLGRLQKAHLSLYQSIVLSYEFSTTQKHSAGFDDSSCQQNVLLMLKFFFKFKQCLTTDRQQLRQRWAETLNTKQRKSNTQHAQRRPRDQTSCVHWRGTQTRMNCSFWLVNVRLA